MTPPPLFPESYPLGYRHPGLKPSLVIKAVLQGSTFNIDFPHNTVPCFRDMLHESTFSATLLDFLMTTYMLQGTYCNAISIRNIILTLFCLGFFGVPGPGGGLQKSPLHKSESIDAIDMKLGG